MDKKTMLTRTNRIVAGLVYARCLCCQEPRTLVPHRGLEANLLVCPGTRLPYLDRGDGLYERAGDEPVVGVGEEGSAASRAVPEEDQTPDVLSDRPSRTGPKERITLERATFAERR